MRVILATLGSLLLLTKSVLCDVPYIWPLPSTYSNGADTLSLSSTFSITSTGSNADVDSIVSRFQGIIFSHKTSHEASIDALNSLTVSVSDPTAPLQLNTDESYTLTVPINTNVATLNAVSLAGLNRGLETFTQLIHFNATAHAYQIQQAPWSIQDTPRFSYRGILLDTSRHFQPLRNILTFIDSLAISKYNVLHWHISDSQSFPLESLSYPRLWMAAYSDEEKYTQDDVREVVEYARLRGIRVMPEIDVPGHAEAMCKGYPEICPSTTCLSPIDPSTNATFDLLTGLFLELTGGKQGQGLFPENLFHLGGDEVDTSCWSTVPHIAIWLAQNNLTTDQGYMYVVERAHAIIHDQGRDTVNWDEVWEHFGTQLDKQSIIHNWRDKKFVKEAAEAGYRVIVSDSDVWYLDHLDVSWQKFYENEPTAGVNEDAQKLIIGGETCMWGETVDASDLFSTVWPRASAAAERLWSPMASITNTSAALNRYEWFRCYMDSRGIGAAPSLNSLARSSPGGPGACKSQ